ncbi:MAG TPA: cyclic pyranopterin monophosphate synthase MoaC [candidate division Zixibacteria bacterium]|nr:cyclic pyranopterin monophosphate synthase MoaC [candidate division Zixibacteria bacterium]
MSKLTHTDSNGKATMVDISHKQETVREATVSVKVILNENTFELIQSNNLKKGDVLTVAKIAGIQAAKKTSELIPLCHQIALDTVDIQFELDKINSIINIIATSKTSAPTGVEMEAFCAASITAVTIYDMVKAVQKDVVISELKLLHKTGGKSGEFKRTDI